MDKEVLIHVRGLHMMEEDGEQEPVEIVVPGEYYFRNGSHYLRYEEILEDFSEPTINYIKISPKGIEVRKKGIVKCTHGFRTGKEKYDLLYHSLRNHRDGDRGYQYESERR